MTDVEIVSADRGMIRAVLANLRQDDMLEMTACEVDFDKMPDIIMRHKVFVFGAFTYDLGPIAIWGLAHRRSGVGAGFAFGTDNWGVALRPMLHQIRRFVLPFLVQAGYHRVEAAALSRRHDVARFMSLIGAEPEGVLHGYGSNGEAFTSYRWLADEYKIQRAEHTTEAYGHATH
jgi:hypothetical protein